MDPNQLDVALHFLIGTSWGAISCTYERQILLMPRCSTKLADDTGQVKLLEATGSQVRESCKQIHHVELVAGGAATTRYL